MMNRRGLSSPTSCETIFFTKPLPLGNLFGDGHLEGEIKMHLGLSHPHIVGLYEVARIGFSDFSAG